MVFVVLQYAPYKIQTAVFKTQRNVRKYFCHRTRTNQSSFYGGPHLNKLGKKLMGQKLVVNCD